MSRKLTEKQREAERIMRVMLTPGTPEHEALGDDMEKALAELDEGLPPVTDGNLLNTRMSL